MGNSHFAARRRLRQGTFQRETGDLPSPGREVPKRRVFKGFTILGPLSALASGVHLCDGDVLPCGRYGCAAPGGPYISTSSNQLRANVKRFDQTAVIEQSGCAEQLARFFSQVLPIRLPVQVTALRRGGAKLRDATVLEFGSLQHAIFVSNLPLEFDDHVRLQRAPQGPEADAVVVAVHYHEGQKAVAVRFTQGPCNWTRQP